LKMDENSARKIAPINDSRKRSAARTKPSAPFPT
jgi:hypothetical protein